MNEKIKLTLMVGSISSGICACSTTDKKIRIGYHEPPQMGLLLTEISAVPFNITTRDLTIASEQLTNMVVAKLAQQHCMTVSPGSNRSLEG